ncbi:MAG TPA: hypothetical protein VFQ41_12115, partial [Candidatus Angelobacter sp.]|nr:hypothetical protein [Candidatus Angelobacter sp.]
MKDFGGTKALLHPFAGIEQAENKLVDRLLRGQGLLMDGRLALGWGLELKDRAHWLAGFVGHLDKVGSIGLQVDEGGAVIVAA